MPIQPLTFTGVSSLSESLQTVLSRAVSIASIPLKQLQAANTDVLQRKMLLTGLGGAAEALGAAVTKLGTIASGGALSASSSNPAKVAVQNTGTTRPVAFTISDITSIATAASAATGPYSTSTSTPVSQTGTVQLVVDDTPFELTLGDNSLAGLRDAVNAAGAGVTATIFTAGPAENYLSLSANSAGALKSLKLMDGPSSDPIPAFASSSLGSNGSAAIATTATFSDAATDPVSATGAMQLVLGSQTYDFSLADNSLAGLRDAINALGAGVTATVVTDGPSGYLSVSSDTVGHLAAFQLIDDPEGAATETFAAADPGSSPSPAQGATADFADPLTSPVSVTGSMQLVAGAQTHDITLADNSLTGLRDAINALGAGITAVIVTDESGSHLSVSADSAGELTAFNLLDNPSEVPLDLLEADRTSLGSNVAFKLNGIPVEQKTNMINSVVPGMTFAILGTTAESEKVVLNFSSDRAQLSTAVSEFIAAYNTMQEMVGQQVGQNAGMLSGAMVVRDLQTNMRALAGYSADGAVKSLAEMGITFDQAGKISFDSGVLNALPDSGFQGALAFFGSSTSGFGAMARRFSQLTDPVTGSIKLEQDGFDRTDRSLQSQIATLEERINAMQIATAQRLQLADALLAQLESQQTVLDASIKSASLVLYGRNDK